MIKLRLPFMLLAFVNLLAGITAGLIRMGWNFSFGALPVQHGAIMVGGFLGTLILLEKVIPLKRKILFIIPIINALSLVMIIPAFNRLGQAFLLIGALGLLYVLILYFIKQPDDLSIMLMLIGACCLIMGHSMLISRQFYPIAFPWWMGFIFFVIVGERLELSKFLPVTRINKNVLIGFLFLFLVGLIVPFHGIGRYMSAAGLVFVAIWLLRHDIISIAIKKSGVTRFSAYGLFGGCIALVLTGTFLISLPDVPMAYDAVVHTFFLGFVFSMIFAHGPIILPGVLGLSIRPYHWLLYVPLIILWSSLMIRILSDLAIISLQFRLISGWLTTGSILGYFIILAVNAILTPKATNAHAV